MIVNYSSTCRVLLIDKLKVNTKNFPQARRIYSNNTNSFRIDENKTKWVGHKQHPEMEFVGAVYDDLKDPYVAAKKNLKALGERLNFLSARVDEMAS